jgi:hypothetical protein
VLSSSGSFFKIIISAPPGNVILHDIVLRSRVGYDDRHCFFHHVQRQKLLPNAAEVGGGLEYGVHAIERSSNIEQKLLH